MFSTNFKKIGSSFPENKIFEKSKIGCGQGDNGRDVVKRLLQCIATVIN